MGFAVENKFNLKKKILKYFKENLGSGPFPKDEQGNRLYSDIHYLETYKVISL